MIKRKKVSLCAAALLLSIIAGCSSSGEEKAAVKKPAAVEKTASSNGGESKPADNQQAHEEKKNETLSGEGTYNGRIDNNSIEVETAGETIALRLKGEHFDAVDSMSEGTTISFTYLKNDAGQYELIKFTAIAPPSAQPEKTKEIVYTVNGETVKKTGYYTVGNIGYAFYKFDSYESTEEEPRKDLLYSNEHEENFARIEILGTDYNAEELKKWSQEELKDIGNVQDVSGSEKIMEGTVYSAFAENDENKKYIVIAEKDGKGIKVTLHLVKSDLLEHEFKAMLSTLTIQ
ncbi:hypothetical protein ACFFJY_13090 [Fictibacillus aquaticus]|uniref:Lipoprotein n=1 Tax=Fictibacillus aquaticus TaxID=2021314 RepID=A0A235FEH5_9BACL|nr:hypothetical protein [Fictibacillus aquaticus]OYD59165.1 hypothetical protein CGZ90_04510 [Fictibacillus aquaticus]